MAFRIQNGQLIPKTPTQNRQPQPNNAFEQAFLEKLQGKKAPVKLSAHAQERMVQRDIHLTVEEFGKLDEAINSLEKKGARESLLLLGDMVFIASVQNRTIITAMRGEEMDIVTNIDSAVSIT